MADPIRYRGHGRYEAYYPAVSVLGVMGHELIHMARFRSQAAREGRVVIQSGVRLHLRLEGGLVVASGGEAYMRSRPARDAAGSATRGDTPGEAPAAPAPPQASQPSPTDGGSAYPRALLSREQRRIQQALQQLQPLGVREEELRRQLQQIAVRLALAQAVPADEVQVQALLAQARRAYQQAEREARPAAAGWAGAFA